MDSDPSSAPRAPSTEPLTNLTTPSAHSQLLDNIGLPPVLDYSTKSDAQLTKHTLDTRQHGADTYSIDDKLGLQSVQYFENLPEDIVSHFKNSSVSSELITAMADTVEVIRQSQDSSAEFLKRKTPNARNVAEVLALFDNHALDYSIILGDALIVDSQYHIEKYLSLIGRFLTAEDKDTLPIVAVEGRLCGGKDCCSIEDLHSFMNAVKCFRLDPPNESRTVAQEVAAEKNSDAALNFEQALDSDLTAFGLRVPNHKPQSQPIPSQDHIQVLTQLWDQLTSKDLTFGILTDYNESLFLLRSRHSCTLYVSRPIHIHDQNPRLIVSISCIIQTAFADAISRRQATPLINSSDCLLPSSQQRPKAQQQTGFKDDEGPDKERLKVSIGQESTPGVPVQVPMVEMATPFPTGLFPEIVRPNSESENFVITHTKNFVEVPSSDTIHLILRTDWILYSAHPSVLTRYPMSFDIGKDAGTELPPEDSPGTTGAKYIISPSSGSTKESDKLCPPLLVLQSLASGNTLSGLPSELAAAWSGYYDNGEQVVAVVVKIKPLWELKSEFLAYVQLQQMTENGIPTCLGLYQMDAHPTFGALILSHNGESIPEGKVSVDERHALRRILQSVHECGVLHNELSSGRRLARNAQGMISLLDFHRADIYTIDERFNSSAAYEMKSLETLLDDLNRY